MSGTNTARLVVLLDPGGQNWSVCGPRDELHEQYEELRAAVTACQPGYHEIVAQQDSFRTATEHMLIKIENVVAVAFQEP